MGARCMCDGQLQENTDFDSLESCGQFTLEAVKEQCGVVISNPWVAKERIVSKRPEKVGARFWSDPFPSRPSP